MTTARNGCFDHPPYPDYYLPTGAPDTLEYRIEHVLTRDCQFRRSELGKNDQKCDGCKHRSEK